MQQVNNILGDCAGFFTRQAERLRHLGIIIECLDISHLAFRTATLEDYLDVRRKLEPYCSANVENVWNDKPISKLLLKEPLNLSHNATTCLIELIPPVHQSTYALGLEHVGVVIGETFTEFGQQHKDKLTGQQDQGEFCQPYYISFPDHTNVKFYRYSLQDVCILEGKQFDGFHHTLD